MATQTAHRSDALKDNGAPVETLWHAVDEGAGTLETVPALVRKVLSTGAWRKRAYRGRVFEHARFLDFITSKPLAGCGWPPEKVEALIKADAETLALWREAVTPAVGTNQHTMAEGRSNSTTHRGTTKAYTLERLKRESPKLFQSVVNRELSANAAAIAAGFRKKPSPFAQVIRLLPKLSTEERSKLREMLR